MSLKQKEKEKGKYSIQCFDTLNNIGRIYKEQNKLNQAL